MVRQLREELAVLVPQLFAAEQAALLFWRYQVAIGDATQHAFEQHLAAFSMRRSRGLWRPIKDWWWGATPPVPEVTETGLPSVGAGQSDWTDQPRFPRSLWRQSGCWCAVGCLTSPTGCGCHRCPAPGPPRRGGLPASNSLDAAGGESSSRTGAMT